MTAATLDKMEPTKAAPRRANVRGHDTGRLVPMHDEITPPIGLCRCGCGGQTRIATRTRKELGQVRGEPVPYLRGHKHRIAVAERFATKYVSRDCGYETPCWVWQATIDRHGYGRIGHEGRAALAHRVSYEIRYAPCPSPLDHLCRNRACVNPEHLEAVTDLENFRRGESPHAINKRKMHCVNGHPFNEANTYIRPSGYRDCRVCIRARVRRYQGPAA
jgi:hypothetical protein